MSRLLVICNPKTCSKNGSRELLKFIKQKQIKGLTVKTQYCFGKCGNGCVVFYVTEQQFYFYVNQNDLLTIINSSNISLIFTVQKSQLKAEESR